MFVRPLIRSLLVATLVVASAAVIVSTVQPGGDADASRARTVAVRDRVTVPLGLDGLNETMTAAGTYGAQLVAQENARIAREQEAARDALARQKAAQERGRTTASSPTVTGSCAEMKPPGFPDSIIWRESRGDPNAYNSGSGAMGCAQILRSHFNPGATCAGLGYADCWRKMYEEQGLTPWACTPESGCG